MSDLIAINAGAFNLAIQALKRAGKDEIAEQLESDCECVPDLIEQQQARIDELAATVERLHGLYVRLTNNVEFADNGEGCYVADGNLMQDFDVAFTTTPHQNLNSVKREAWIKGYQSTDGVYHGENTEYMSIVRLANQHYPNKE